MYTGMKTLVITLGVVIFALLAVLFFYNPKPAPAHPGGGVRTSTADSTSTTQGVVSPDAHVVVTEPLPSSTVASPLTIKGSVTGGGWFFEATFPVKVMDSNGAILGRGQAQAQGDWTTTGTVPFTATISFTKPDTANGMIVFAKDNPSGAPQNDMSFSIPVVFGNN